MGVLIELQDFGTARQEAYYLKSCARMISLVLKISKAKHLTDGNGRFLHPHDKKSSSL